MTKQKTIEQIKAGWDGLDRPNDGELFQHYKGGKYVIIATGFFEDGEVPCIVYRSIENDIVWVRSAKNFLEEIENSGIVQPRFKRI